MGPHWRGRCPVPATRTVLQTLRRPCLALAGRAAPVTRGPGPTGLPPAPRTTMRRTRYDARPARGMTGPVPPGRARLAIWSRGGGGWVECALDEIVWLDRKLLSASEDQTLHRSPRCAALRYVHRGWELFSRDPTYLVYVAPYHAGSPLSCEAVEGTAAYVLPVATAQHETLPVRLADGVW